MIYTKITDDFKIMTNKAIIAIKDKDEKCFINSIKYILKELKYTEYEAFAKYLYKKIEE